MTASPDPIASPQALSAALGGARYLCDPSTALSLWLALRMERPLMLEGPAGVGKTDLARAAAQALGRSLIRLQCYEGLDEAKALYEWDYAKQMLYTQLLRDAIAAETHGATIAGAAQIVAKSEASFFTEHFLLSRPLLAAIRSEAPVVLLIDEVDRADPEFEAFLLEILSELQVTIPELGTFRAKHPPLVLLTTNATREMTEALRRRCLHAFLDYPASSRELAILELVVPGIDSTLASHLVAFIGELRKMDLRKAPAVSETLDWARALVLLGKSKLDPDLVRDTLGLLLKHQEDKVSVEPRLESLLKSTTASS
ncbi:MoxR family ATPase [Polyangium sp. y55x31]|uniref:AAA family ATPase n=1 Tax=Polyangium sp. y55x31 TaxID=3042688 RepID=UPI002482FD24|nr:MoxR family ATPase [Polyangium sp. y55x31]MDI1478993.1 MoxR family ATPase [Polyangium sp. y55x31]